MSNVFYTLQERGFIQQVTHTEPLIELLEKEKVTFYIGFDPTADSLHVGSLLPIMAMVHMQRAGHRPIAIVGGGTAMIGDPSGKTEMRQIMTRETIEHNMKGLKEQLSRFLDFSEGKALMVDNGEWLLPLNYIEFLRDIGVYFSVNRMLTAECFRTRLERGLSFIEFNYMLLQAYDYLTLYRRYGCKIQMGGDDQWSNILAGADLIRRMVQAEVYGITFPLLVTSSGRKMGKTEAGTVWLDPKKTSPYDFYQYWRNTEDPDVERFLALFTLLPMDQVRELGALRDREINEAKRVLAFEVTKLTHGEEEAYKAQEAADKLFGAGKSFTIPFKDTMDEENKPAEGVSIPSTQIPISELAAGIPILELLTRTGLASSRSNARRLITQGGIYINQERVQDIERLVTLEDSIDNIISLRKGKKVYHLVRVV